MQWHGWYLNAPQSHFPLKYLPVPAQSLSLFFLIKENFFLAGLGLRCCAWACPRCREWGLLCSRAQASHCGGFSCWMEEAMAAHSSPLAWKIPWTEEPGRLQSMGSLTVGHDWATSLSLFTFMHWRREMATRSSVLAWRIPGMGEPGGLPSMGSHRVGHDWSDLAAAALVEEREF